MKALSVNIRFTAGIRVAVLITGLLSLVSLVEAQPAPVSQWVRRVGLPTVREYGYTSLQLGANRYVSAGGSSAGNGRVQSAFLAFSDSAGNTLSQRTYPLMGFRMTNISAVSQLNGGRFLALGYGLLVNGYARPVMMLTQYDSLGSVQWQQPYTGGDSLRIEWNMTAAPTGGYTSGERSLPNFWRTFVTRFDARGRQLWERGYGTFSRGHRIAPLPDGAYVLASVDYTRTIQPQYNYREAEMKLYRLSPAGDSLTSVWLDTPGYHDYPLQLLPTLDGGLLVIGYQEQTFQSVSPRGFCIKLDSAWHEQWRHIVPVGRFRQVQELANGHFLLSGTTLPPYSMIELAPPTYATPADTIPTVAWELTRLPVSGETMFVEPGGRVRLMGITSGTVPGDADLGIQLFTGLQSSPVSVDMCARPPQLTQPPTFGALMGNTLTFTLDSAATLAGPRYGEVSLVEGDFGDGSPPDTGYVVSHAFASPAPVRVRCRVVNNLWCATTADLFPFGPVGVPEEVTAAVSVFPNPSATGAYTVRTSAGATYTVLDATGRAVATGRLTGPEAELDLRAQSTGVYALRLSWPDGRSLTRRLIRQ